MTIQHFTSFQKKPIFVVQNHSIKFKMSKRHIYFSVLSILFSLSIIAQKKTIKLFPGEVPDETKFLLQKDDWSGNKVGGYPVLRISNVSEPSITFYRANTTNKSEATIIVCPGGGYNILAYNLEGSEICEHFNQHGIQCILLKYRVPRRRGRKKHAAPLQDIQRAIRYTRAHAKEWGIAPDKIGVLGFSAGGHLCAMASNAFNDATYTPTDAMDSESARPDFCMLVYPAYLASDNFSLSPEINVNAHTPPTFIVQTQDDKEYINSSLFYYYALKENNVPATMHLYPSGGHGYGLRNTGKRVNEWGNRALDWLTDLGIFNETSHRR